MAVKPTFDNGVVQLYQGDARRVLRDLPAESVHCVVTSPPYWGLRDYGLAPLVWGGVEWHEHEWGAAITVSDKHFDKGTSTLSGSNANQMAASTFSSQGAFCPCGAWRGSLGLEPTIDLYVQHIVEIFREVWRVLRKDGTLWLNMGDSYNAGTSATRKASTDVDVGYWQNAGNMGDQRLQVPGLKTKDLCMMPARVALALQADGWWLRSDIVWSKPNPMPESVTDRPTRAHEYLFLLAKAERYYYDAESIKESATEPRRAGQNSYANVDHDIRHGTRKQDALAKRTYAGFNDRYDFANPPAGRNKRSVWEIATEPYPEAHFATFPQKLVEPCVLAGTSERGVCPDCGAPWERVVEVEDPEGRLGKGYHDHTNDLGRGQRGVFPTDGAPTKRTTGWRPTCDCGREETVPGTVLDCFAGSGTVAYVAQRLGRRAIGIDLSAEYLALAEKRLEGLPMPMAL